LRCEGETYYQNFPESAYFIDRHDIRRQGDSLLLEIPVTVIRTRQYGRLVESLRHTLSSRYYGTIIFKRLFPYYLILIPTGGNLDSLMKILQLAKRENRPYIELAIHSSELMPGGSPKLPTEQSIQHLYEDLEIFFAAATTTFQGRTLCEYYQEAAAGRSLEALSGTRANL
jgi:hypothetical protein